ncbi:MAG: FAD-dependent monooxygenase [Gammaproteobacteria bacterium]|nr:FAD-dependent monooxygenase [Gammaproteobacteria bacterium]
MKIVCLGGGPSSLYFSILMKKQNPNHDITVIERGPRHATWGFGVVFSDETLKGFMEADAPTYKRIVEQFAYWSEIDTVIHDKKITSDGHGFCGMSRLRLLNTFHDRCDELGVKLRFETDITNLDQLEMDQYDLVLAGDGVASMLREKYKTEFGADMDWRANKFCWLGTTLPLDAFTFIFRKNEHGWWWVHAYRYEEGMSTWIVECSEQTWRNAGLDKLEGDVAKTEAFTKAYMEKLWAPDLKGHPLITNRSIWRTFPVVSNQKWFHKNIVLMGDAVRSAHFSIGSGTKLAMEDAIHLNNSLKQHSDVQTALQSYQDSRKPDADRLIRTAITSLSWFEHLDRYAETQSAEQFTFNMLARSKRITYENLRLRDPAYIKSVDRWFAEEAKAASGFDDIDLENPTVPMFQPFKIGNMRVENRTELSAMCQYCATDGLPDDWHLMHYGSRAVGGTGLINTEMTCISPEARITPGCTGIWNDEQTQQWKRIVDFVHAHSKSKISLQLGHAGRKGSTCVPWNGGIDQPLKEGAWEIIAPSAIPYLKNSQVPREATIADMDKYVADFINATKNAEKAGFDMIEVHFAHGYLLSGFISPYTNKRTDEFGGSIENRLKFPLRVLKAARDTWPKNKPISVRISATDWVGEGGLTEAEMLIVARKIKEYGGDIINVSTGQVTKDEQPMYGRMFQVPFADQVRNEIGIPTIVAGNFTTADQVNTVIAAGRTDIVALGRPIMNEPHFALTAAAHYGFDKQYWPPQYISGKFAAKIKAKTENADLLELRLAAKPPKPQEALAIALARGELLAKDKK